MAFTFAEFQAKFPQFSATSEAYFDLWKADAVAEVNAVIWGSFADRAVMLLTAHYLTRFPEASGSAALHSGPVGSKSTGSMSVSYVQVQSVTDRNIELSTTGYGMQFLRLQRQAIIPARCV